MNIMKNVIPNDIKKCIPRDPPWIHKSLKAMLKKKIDYIVISKNMVTKMRIKIDLILFVMSVRKPLIQLKFCILTTLAPGLTILTLLPKIIGKSSTES